MNKIIINTIVFVAFCNTLNSQIVLDANIGFSLLDKYSLEIDNVDIFDESFNSINLSGYFLSIPNESENPYGFLFKVGYDLPLGSDEVLGSFNLGAGITYGSIGISRFQTPVLFNFRYTLPKEGVNTNQVAGLDLEIAPKYYLTDSQRPIFLNAFFRGGVHLGGQENTSSVGFGSHFLIGAGLGVSLSLSEQ